MSEIQIFAVFESHRGKETETVRVDAMTERQFSYVRWHERIARGLRLVAIVGQQVSPER